VFRYDWLLIKKERVAAGLTQAQAADNAGLPLRMYQRYEAGKEVFC